jgi:hypothetical protein
VIAAAHRLFVRRARSDPDWGWLLVRLDVSHNVMLAALGSFARRDLRRAIKASRLRVSNDQVALVGAGGALLAVMRAVLDGRARGTPTSTTPRACCGSSGSRARMRPKSPVGHCPLRTCRRGRHHTIHGLLDLPARTRCRALRTDSGEPEHTRAAPPIGRAARTVKTSLDRASRRNNSGLVETKPVPFPWRAGTPRR